MNHCETIFYLDYSTIYANHKRDEGDVIKRAGGNTRGNPTIVVPDACLTASFLRCRSNASPIHQQRLKLLHVADAVIGSFFLSFFASQVPNGLKTDKTRIFFVIFCV